MAMKMKLLSPAGDMESLKMAVFNGADEVYLGVKDFNARNIQGFSLETLKTALDFAHLYGVRVFLTVNILFRDDEMQSALDLVVDAYNMGVDAFIVQDIGLCDLIHSNYPQIELHASTQMGLHNLEGVKAMEKLGFKRVVLARETPLSEIKRIKDNSNLEIEYFCQGALCVSFSGNCYMSSYLFDASGNRGKCKQLCRLPFKLCHNGKVEKSGYLLSAKDFNMLARLQDLEKAGVTSLKIEGRARRPYYVAVATKTYRTALNMIEQNKLQSKIGNNPTDIFHKNDLALGFNRGYTEGYFNGNNNIISNLQNHIGISLGVVKKFVAGKKFNEIFLSSNLDFSPKSTLKFLRNGTEVVTISAFDISKQNGLYKITTTSKVAVGDEARLINDYEKEQQMLNGNRKLPISINISGRANTPIVANCTINGHEYSFCGDVLLPAQNSPLTCQDIESCFSKSDIFSPQISCRLESVFLPKSKLNEFRRNVYENIKNNLIKINRKILQKINLINNENKLQIFNNKINKNKLLLKNNLKINISKKSAQNSNNYLKIDKKSNLLENNDKNINLLKNDMNNLQNQSNNNIFTINYFDKNKKIINQNNIQFVENINEKLLENIVCFDPEIYNENEILNFKQIVENQNKTFILNLPNFAMQSDIEYLKQMVEKHKIAIMVQNAYALNFDTKKYIGAFMNVFNSYSAQYYSLPFMTAEIGEHNVPYMTLRHCPMKEHKGAICNNCPFDHDYEYVLDSGKRFKLKRKKLSTCTFYLT